MARITATEFKAKCLKLMDRVAERRETYTITKRGKPVAKLIPLQTVPRDNIFGWLRTRGSIAGDILQPISPGKWGILAEWDELNRATRLHTTSRAAKAPKRRRSGR